MKKRVVLSVILVLLIVCSCFFFVSCNEKVIVYLDYQIVESYHSAYGIKIGSLILKPEDPTFINGIFTPGRGGLSWVNNGGYDMPDFSMDNPRMGEGYNINTNYLFIGWYKEPECLRPWNFAEDRVHKDTTIYAKWVIAP